MAGDQVLGNHWLWLAAGIPLTFVFLFCLLLMAARADHCRRREQLRTRGRVVATRRGPCEVIEVGTGRPVLVLHGGIGGADQMADVMPIFSADRWRFLCISRPGYLRTPLSSGPSVDDQARLCAALLDELGVGPVPVFALSLGAAFALRFAQMFPTHCSALVLAGAAFQNVSESNQHSKAQLRRFRQMRRPDFIGWFAQRFGLRMFNRWQGVSPRLCAEVARDPRRRPYLQALIAPLATISLRLDGTENDVGLQAEIDQLTLQGISQPTLLIHSESDAFASIAEARRIAATLPQATLRTTEGGGHVCLFTHRDELVPIVEEFLGCHAPPRHQTAV